MDELAINVVHDPVQGCFEMITDNFSACLTYIYIDNDTIDVNRTFVPEELRGKGVAAKLAKAVLDYAAQEQLRIIPTCSYMKSYMERMGLLIQ